MHRTRRRLVACGVLLAGVALSAIGLYAANAKDDIPGACDMAKVSFEIVGATFVTKLDGVSATFTESEPEKFHGMVLTVKVRKPAGEQLQLFAPDLCLHYRHGDAFDVMPCQGLSTFSTTNDTDRVMNFFARSYGSTTTGVATQGASTVYVDAFFQYIEPDTSDLCLLVAQSVGAQFTTKGW